MENAQSVRLALCTLVVITAACGPKSVETQINASRSPSSVPPSEFHYPNYNDRSKPLGQLCWVLQETGQLGAYVIGSTFEPEPGESEFPSREESAKLLKGIRESLKSLPKALPSSGELPRDLRPFMERLRSDIIKASDYVGGKSDDQERKARSDIGVYLVKSFRPSEYPAYDKWLAAAKANPQTCTILSQTPAPPPPPPASP